MKSEVIPRNLNEPDLFDIGLGLKIKFSDLPLLAMGAIIGNKTSHLVTKLITMDNINTGKLVIYVGVSVGTLIGFILSKIKIEDQSLIEVLGNYIIFVNRKIIYRGDRLD